MKIRTTPLFKVRRLASYTKRAVPVIKHRGRQQLLIRWNLINREKMEREIFNSCIAILKYIISEQASTMVVISGAAITAGSRLSFFAIMGGTHPKNLDINTVQIKVSERVIAKIIL